MLGTTRQKRVKPPADASADEVGDRGPTLAQRLADLVQMAWHGRLRQDRPRLGGGHVQLLAAGLINGWALRRLLRGVCGSRWCSTSS